MKSIIEEMYYGTLHPFSEVQKQSAERTEKSKKLLEEKRSLLEQFLECKEAFEQYLENYADFESECSYEQFIKGFKTGAKLMLEIFSTNE